MEKSTINKIIDSKYITPLHLKTFLNFLIKKGFYKEWIVNLNLRYGEGVLFDNEIKYADELLLYSVLDDILVDEDYITRAKVVTEWENYLLDKFPDFLQTSWNDLLDQVLKIGSEDIMVFLDKPSKEKSLMICMDPVPDLHGIRVSRCLMKYTKQERMEFKNKGFLKLSLM